MKTTELAFCENILKIFIIRRPEREKTLRDVLNRFMVKSIREYNLGTDMCIIES